MGLLKMEDHQSWENLLFLLGKLECKLTDNLPQVSRQTKKAIQTKTMAKCRSFIDSSYGAHVVYFLPRNSLGTKVSDGALLFMS